MNKKGLLSWINKYDKEYNLNDRKVEERLREKFREKEVVTKSDLIQIVKWKFQGRLLGRQKIILKLLEDVDGPFVYKLSRLALKSEDDEIRLGLLCLIKGVGNAISSVILAFYDPKNYGILDIHSWRGLFGKEPRDIWSNQKHAIRFFNKLRSISSNTGLSCRKIEKGYFMKDKSIKETKK